MSFITPIPVVPVPLLLLPNWVTLALTPLKPLTPVQGRGSWRVRKLLPLPLPLTNPHPQQNPWGSTNPCSSLWETFLRRELVHLWTHSPKKFAQTRSLKCSSVAPIKSNIEGNSLELCCARGRLDTWDLCKQSMHFIMSMTFPPPTAPVVHPSSKLLQQDNNHGQYHSICQIGIHGVPP